MGKPQAIIYVRVSDPTQVDGTSLEFQEQECRKYCESHGFEAAALFREEGESAKDLSLKNRKEFLKALEYCRKHKGKVQHFVVLRVDRFARSTEDHFAVRKLLLDCGVSLHSVTEKIGNDPADKFIETVLAGAAEYDNAIRKQRCVSGMESRIRQGIHPWRPPLGYQCAYTKRRGEKKFEPDKPDPEIFPIIQRALKEYAEGLWSQRQLAYKLDEWGLARIRGKKTYKQFVNQFLHKHLRFYAGIVVNPWTGKEHQGLHVPMITPEELQLIRLRLNGLRPQVKARHERFNPLFPLKQTVRCSGCERWLTGGVSRGKGGHYAYYFCCNSTCPWYGKSTPKAKLEASFREILGCLTPHEAFLSAFNESILQHWQEQAVQLRQQARQEQRRLKELEDRLDRIYELYELGHYSVEEFKRRKDRIEQEIATAKQGLREAGSDDLDPEAVLAYASRFLRKLADQWMDCPPSLRQQMQQVIFPEGIRYDRERGFRTLQLGPIYQLYVLFLEEESVGGGGTLVWGPEQGFRTLRIADVIGENLLPPDLRAVEVPSRGLEPLPLAGHGPKPCASAVPPRGRGAIVRRLEQKEKPAQRPAFPSAHTPEPRKSAQST